VRWNTHFVTSVTRVNLTHFVGVPTSNTYCIQKGQLGAEVSRCIYIWSSTLSTLVPALFANAWVTTTASTGTCCQGCCGDGPAPYLSNSPLDVTTPRTKSVRCPVFFFHVRTMRTERSSSEFRINKGTGNRKSKSERNFLLSLEKSFVPFGLVLLFRGGKPRRGQAEIPAQILPISSIRRGKMKPPPLSWKESPEREGREIVLWPRRAGRRTSGREAAATQQQGESKSFSRCIYLVFRPFNTCWCDLQVPEF
jgi:hypothetical protein